MQGIHDDVSAQLAGVNANLSELVNRFATAFPMGAVQGTFTCSNAATTTVTDTNTKATSAIFIFPTNAAAAALMAGSSSLYLSARTADTSFALTTADAGSAAGTETFLYILINLG
ncbi:MAG: hypothetical protein P8Y47_03810 [Alphaproteobacteria bacterium]